MGKYTDNLFKKGRKAPLTRRSVANLERLVSCAIRLENGQCLRGTRDHYTLRSNAGWDDPTKTKPGTTDGFWTSNNRFVTRHEGRILARACGQVPERYDRELLSCDIEWNPK